jgi:hypothetical protein
MVSSVDASRVAIVLPAKLPLIEIPLPTVDQSSQLDRKALLGAVDSFLKRNDAQQKSEYFCMGPRGRAPLQADLKENERLARTTTGNTQATHALKANQMRTELNLDTIAAEYSEDLGRPCTVKELATKLRNWVRDSPLDKSAARVLDLFLKKWDSRDHT